MPTPANKWWIEAGRRKRQRFIAMPCHGVGRRTGHLYYIQDCRDAEALEIGYMSLSRARKTFNKENVFVAPSHSICPDCMQRYIKGAEK